MSTKKIIPILGIPGLVGLMSVALLALLGVQWYWVTNAVSLKEAQFDRKVNDALNQVVERLQDSETAHFITHDIRSGHFPVDLWVQRSGRDSNQTKPRVQVVTEERIVGPRSSRENVEIQVVQMGKPDSGNVKMAYHYSFSTGNRDLVFHQQNDEEVVVINTDSLPPAQVVLAQRNGEEYIHTMVRRLLMTHGPVEERIAEGQVDSLLREAFVQQGIEDPFVYELVRRPMRVSPAGMRPAGQDFVPEGAYAVRLFPRDLEPSNDHLLVRFPGRQTGTIRAMGLLLPTSGVLVLVVVLCFGLTLFALQRQKKLSEMKTDFINNMTHEFKTPISTISLALQALEDPDMRNSGVIERFTGIIGEENERLRGHVERVLQAAAIERGTLQLNLKEVDAHTTIGESVARIRLHVEERRGTIRFEPGAQRPLIQADPVHLAGILDNLLDNANKYSPRPPLITVRTRNVSGGFELSVRDQGQGMNREVQKRIFEKFYREPQGNVHDVKGFGLGLSYVQAMVEAHGGRISVESEPGKGSCFTIFIPQSQA